MRCMTIYQHRYALQEDVVGQGVSCKRACGVQIRAQRRYRLVYSGIAYWYVLAE